jgi:hypothetical protein
MPPSLDVIIMAANVDAAAAALDGLLVAADPPSVPVAPAEAPPSATDHVGGPTERQEQAAAAALADHDVSGAATVARLLAEAAGRASPQPLLAQAPLPLPMPATPGADSGLPVDADAVAAADVEYVTRAAPGSPTAPAAPVSFAGAAPWVHRGVVVDASTQLGQHRRCVFCGIVAGKQPVRVVYEDARFLAFHDRAPCGLVHYQVSQVKIWRVCGVSVPVSLYLWERERERKREGSATDALQL